MTKNPHARPLLLLALLTSMGLGVACCWRFGYSRNFKVFLAIFLNLFILGLCFCQVKFDTVDIAFSNFTFTWSSSASIDMGCWTEMLSTDFAPSFPRSAPISRQNLLSWTAKTTTFICL